MSTVEELAYIEVEASDLAAWRTLAEDVLGLQSVEAGAGRLAYRIDEFAHRIQIREGAADDLTALGFRVADDATFDALVADLKSAGHGVTDGTADYLALRQVQRMAVVTDPNGNRVELVTGMALAETPFESPLGVNGFMTSPGGLGHLFLMCAPGGRQEMLDFYALLGFILSDYIQQEIAPGMLVDAAFTHCNGRHHTLAFAEMPIPKKANHLMIEVKTISDVGLAYDRILDRRIPLVMTLGMHPNDEMFSFYVQTPSGFAIEYGWGGLIIDDEESWEVTTYDRLSSWGHRPPKMVSEALK
ncbi:VOC family protein [Granulicoccus phenolivorans]|uniref:VOC family protein n=1 Tax=Granulicoccus phenolivorans TaxID=266854 RepID=UPI000428A1C8|nr:VOC family protein [Granulicoccus phenolivorans]